LTRPRAPFPVKQIALKLLTSPTGAKRITVALGKQTDRAENPYRKPTTPPRDEETTYEHIMQVTLVSLFGLRDVSVEERTGDGPVSDRRAASATRRTEFPGQPSEGLRRSKAR
jgi:hypothetical protein